MHKEKVQEEERKLKAQIKSCIEKEKRELTEKLEFELENSMRVSRPLDGKRNIFSRIFFISTCEM